MTSSPELYTAPQSGGSARPFVGCTVGVVIVAYNSGDVLPGCLAALAVASDEMSRRCGVDTKTVIVDNASRDPVRPDGAELILLPSNLGFPAAANIGIGQLGDVDFVLLLNPDARLERDALSELLNAFLIPGTAIAGPLLIGEDGTPRPSERPFHSLRRELSHQLLPFSRRDVPRLGKARCLTGACLLIQKGFLTDVGGLDETIRMYLEDVELCWVAHERGRLVAHVSNAVCLHDLGGSSEGIDFRGSLGLHLTLLAARVEFVRRRSGAFAAAGMRTAIAIGAVLRIPFHLLAGSAGKHVAVAVWAITSGRAPSWEEVAQ